jgi:hypothetical protein
MRARVSLRVCMHACGCVGARAWMCRSFYVHMCPQHAGMGRHWTG